MTNIAGVHQQLFTTLTIILKIYYNKLHPEGQKADKKQSCNTECSKTHSPAVGHGASLPAFVLHKKSSPFCSKQGYI